MLRRPPPGELPAGAHDMAREHRILSRLADALSFVPRSLLLCAAAIPQNTTTGSRATRSGSTSTSRACHGRVVRARRGGGPATMAPVGTEPNSRGKHGGTSRGPKQRKPPRRGALGLALTITLLVVAWGYLVKTAVDFGTGWRPVIGVVTATGGGQSVEIFEARTALVDKTCIENPSGPGC